MIEERDQLDNAKTFTASNTEFLTGLQSSKTHNFTTF